MAWRMVEALELGGHTYVWEHNSTVDHILNKINNDNIWSESGVNIGVVPGPDGFIQMYDNDWGPGSFSIHTEEYAEDNKYHYLYNGYFIEFPEYENLGCGYGYPSANWGSSGWYVQERLNHYTIGGVDYYEDPYIEQKSLSGMLINDNLSTKFTVSFMAFRNAKRYEYVEKHGENVTRYFNDPNAISEIFFIADDNNGYMYNVQLLNYHTSPDSSNPTMEQDWFAWAPSGSSIPSMQNMYNWLISHETEPTEDEWKCISTVVGDDGSLTPLAMVYAKDLNGTDPVTTGELSQIERIFSDPYQSKAYISAGLMFNEAGDVEEKYIMSGGNYINATIDSKTSSYEFTYTLDFYLSDDTLIYSHQYTVDHDDHYLMGIQKVNSEDNKARVSMLIKDLSAYSWNTEADFDSEEEAALYMWFIGAGGSNANPFADDNVTDEQIGGQEYYPRPTTRFTRDDDRRPNDNSLNTGMFHAYAVEDADLETFAVQGLWASDAWTKLKEYYATPADAIMGLFMIPFNGFYESTKVPIRLGDLQTRDDLGHEIKDRYPTFDFGDVDIRMESDSYIDFGRYTKIYIYIPFIGEKEIDTNFCMIRWENDEKGNTKIKGHGSIINLVMTVDVVTGTCVAKVFIDDVLRYQWLGDCHSQLPYSWQTHQAATSQTVSTIAAGIGFGAAVVGTVLTHGALFPAALAAVGNLGVQAVKNEAAHAAGGEVHSTGSVGQLAGALAFPYPYITVTRPNIVHSDNQEHFIGQARPQTQTVGEHEGYVRFYGVHLDGIPCTDSERDEIEAILKEGVIV